jgi:thioredoxin 1
MLLPPVASAFATTDPRRRRAAHHRASFAGVSIPRYAADGGGGGGDDDPPPQPPPTTTTTEKKLIIPLVTDANSHSLLRPATDPSRPVLVDAFAPWCGPCKLLDRVLRKSQPRYVGVVDFARWNVDDAERTIGLRGLLAGRGYALSKLPSLVVFRDGSPVAMRPGFANEYQLDDFLERACPDVLERTFDEHGVKMTMIGLPTMAAMMATTPTPIIPPVAVAVEGGGGGGGGGGEGDDDDDDDDDRCGGGGGGGGPPATSSRGGDGGNGGIPRGQGSVRGRRG